jgi:hypothetical protein
MEEPTIDIMLPWHWHKGIGTPRCPLCFGIIEDVTAVWRREEDKKRLRFGGYCPYCDETLNMYCGSNLQLNAILGGAQLEKYKKANERRKKASSKVKNGPSPTRP